MMAGFLHCSTCTRQFTVDDAENGVFQMVTMRCAYCYKEAQRKPHNQSCFGKPTVILSNGRKLLGYNHKSAECNSWCVDRSVCRLVVLGAKHESKRG